MSFATAVMVDTFVPRGTHKQVRAIIYDGDYPGENIPYDLTGHSIFLRLAESWTNPKSLLEKTGTIFLDPTEGRVTFDFVPADTAGLMARSYDLDIIVKEISSGEEWQAFHGTLGITPTMPEEVV